MLEAVSNWSLNRRMVLIASFAMTMALISGGVAMYWAAEVEDNQMLDARLEQLGSTVLSFVENGLSTDAALSKVDAAGHVKTRPSSALLYRYQVWTSDGRMLLRSHEAPASVPMAPLGAYGFDTVKISGEEYRTFSLPSQNGTVVVQVAECIEERVAQLFQLTSYYVAFLLLPFGAVFGATWLLLRRSLRSIDSIAAQLRGRNPLDVAPLTVNKPPREIVPILASLHAMFTRTGEALSVERRFTSVAAHEMRTPLAGLRAQAQLALMTDSPAESQEALGAVIKGVDQAAHMLDQLLDIARIEGMGSDLAMQFTDVNIENVFDDVLRDLRLQFRGQRRQISSELAAIYVEGIHFGLYLVMRNLLANAILYSPEDGRIHASSFRQGDCVVLQVDDSGSGIPQADRERAFERFNRLGQRQRKGVGLGLSIVLMVVELHRARIQLLESPWGGLRVRVMFQRSIATAEAPSESTL
jgi:signal transduction histidine kinase